VLKTDFDKVSDIYKKYYSTMISTAASILPNKQSAEDAVSESILKLIKNIDKITDISSYKTRGYIVIIVKNTSLNLLKKQKHLSENHEDCLEDEIMDNEASPLDNFISEENYHTIIKAIRSLPDSMSNVLYLSTVNGFDNKKIAKLLNLDYNVVKMRLSRAKKAIKQILDEMDGAVREKQK
jgi:RNA polymerase sigma-70 factor (ECF subfamily)